MTSDHYKHTAESLMRQITKAIQTADATDLKLAAEQLYNDLTAQRWMYRDLAQEKAELDQRFFTISRVVNPMIQALVAARECIISKPNYDKAEEALELIRRALAKVPAGE